MSSSLATNSSSDFLSWSARYTLKIVFVAGIGSLESLLGVPTNIINCVVFWRQGLRDRINLFLFCLSFVDCCYFTFMFMLYPLSAMITFHNTDLFEEYNVKIIAALSGVLRGFALTSGCINMAVAIDTCACVLFPHRAASIMRTRTMGLLIFMWFLLVQCLYVLIPIFFQNITIKEGRMQFPYIFSNFLEEKKFVYLFLIFTLEIVVPFVNASVVSVTTVVTVRTLRSAITWRQNTGNTISNTQNRQVALIKMLTIVTFVFAVVMVPCIVFQFYIVFNIHYLYDLNAADQVMRLIVVLYMFSQVNGSFNFFIYYYRSSRFRQELHNMFRLRTA